MKTIILQMSKLAARSFFSLYWIF